MFNINTKWSKVFALGCTHGTHIDKKFKAAALKARGSWNPDICVHLGDAIDMEALMSSHVEHGSGEELGPDVQAGLDFLEELRPTHFLCGNHEDRAWKLQNHRSQFVRAAARAGIESIEDTCQEIGTIVVPYTGNQQNLTIGRVRFMHGTVYNEAAIIHHATAFAPRKGAVVFVHTHRPGQARGKREDHPIGYNVGTGTRRGALAYAKTNMSTLGWGQALLFGVINTKGSFQLWLHEHHDVTQPWMLPV